MTDIKILMSKFSNGHINGYLTDTELLELMGATDTAKNLAKDLEAGNACEMYFLNLYQSLEHMANARRLVYI